MSTYKNLSTANLPDPAIDPAAGEEASDHFNTSNTWTGDGSNHSESSVGFQPDFVWMKSRSNGISHALFDSVRGVGKMLNSNNTVAEITNSQYGYLSSFDTNGHTWTVGSSDGTYGTYPSATYISWNWKAGTSFSNDASATGVGDSDSSGSVNTKAGFSIITYTGNGNSSNAIAHGLGATPEWLLIKARDATTAWVVNHVGMGMTSGYQNLNSGGQFVSATNNLVAISSSTFSVGVDSHVNGNGVNFVAYCFASKEGYSKFGTYEGTNAAGGPFVYLGFRPALVFLKLADSSANGWFMFDNKRDTHNELDDYLLANDSGAEINQAARAVDFYSNGFRLRTDAEFDPNGSGTYVYMAFAEQHFKFSNAR